FEGDRHAIARGRVLLVVRAYHPERLVDAGKFRRGRADRDLERAFALHPERREHGVIEAHRAVHLRRPDGDVAVHGHQSSRPSFRSSEYSPPPRIRKTSPTSRMSSEYSSPPAVQKKPFPEVKCTATIMKMTRASAAKRVNSPSTSRMPPTNSVSATSVSQKMPGLYPR